MSGHEQDIYSLEFSRDGRVLVSGSGDRTARIWDWQNTRCLHELRINDADQQDLGVTSVATSPDSRLVAAGSLDKVVRVWDAVTGQLLERLEGHKDSVYSVAFMPDGKTLVSGSLDKTLRMWQLGAGERGYERNKNACIQVFSGHKVNIWKSFFFFFFNNSIRILYYRWQQHLMLIGLCQVQKIVGYNFGILVQVKHNLCFKVTRILVRNFIILSIFTNFFFFFKSSLLLRVPVISQCLLQVLGIIAPVFGVMNL